MATLCDNCGQASHTIYRCPQLHELDPKRLAANAQRLITLEPSTRTVLAQGIPQLPPSMICPSHTSMLLHGDLESIDQSVLRDRALMPMCLKCCRRRFRELNIDPDDALPAVDTCICTAEMFTHSDCFWCGLEHINQKNRDYEAHYTADLFGGVSGLKCKCSQVPMPIIGRFPVPLIMKMEIMRVCAACAGVVTGPFFGLDGTTRLATPVGMPSQHLPLDVIKGLNASIRPRFTVQDFVQSLNEKAW